MHCCDCLGTGLFLFVTVYVASTSAFTNIYHYNNQKQLLLTSSQSRILAKPVFMLERRQYSQIPLSSTSFTKRMASADSKTENNNIDINDRSITMEKIVTKIGSSTSKVVAGTFFLVLAYERDSFMISFFVGSIINGIMSKVLKKVLNMDRPDGYHDEISVKVLPGDKGMPSSHAMSLGFIGMFTAQGLYDIIPNSVVGALSTIMVIVYVIISLVYRVRTKLHTLNQILVGFLLGSMNALSWKSLMYGTNAFAPSVNVMEFVSANILPESGTMPVPFLVIPAVVGAAVVGSFERRISKWLKSRGKEK